MTKAISAKSAEDRRYRMLVDSIMDYAVYMLDPDGVVASWNAGARRFKGYTSDEIIGQHFSAFYTEEDRETGAPARALETAAADGRFEAEGWRVRKGGDRIWSHVIIDVIKDDDGSIAGFAKITRDLTDWKAAQEELYVAREALFQAQKVEAIGQLTGGVAHDFNNLLMVILSSLELMAKRTGGNERMDTLISTATQAAQRGASLTQRMLAFARRQDLDNTAVDLHGLVKGMSEMLERTLGPQVTVESRFPLTLSKALTDPNHLESALLNLAVNARDAMPDGGPLVISAREETLLKTAPDGLAPGQYVCLSVKDSGHGMDADTVAKAADPFFTTKGIGKGTGLGLSMVQGLAMQSGGRLRLRSKPGKGTTAEIWLPAITEACPEAAKAVEEAQVGAETSLSLKILAVDDDALVLMNTAAMLEDLGHVVVEAMSANAALKAIRDGFMPDIVISDQAMPGMTGSKLAEAIENEWPGLAVILATGYAELPAGDGDHLPRLAKPFMQSQLAQMVETVARRSCLSGSVLPFSRKVA